MRKTLYIISFAAIALAALTSCAKDQFKENVIPAGEKIQVSINGLIGELTPADATKATAGSVVRVKWVNGDKVYVYDGTAASIGTLTVTPDDNNASYALLSGTISASAASPSKLTLVYAKGATEAPAIAGGKISIDLSAQDQTEVPFVLYSTIDYKSDALSKAKECINFEFATSVMTVNCTDLPTKEGSKIDITKAEIDGVSTVCELTVTGSEVTVSGASKGTITRTAGFDQSDSRGAFRLALAADPAAPAARNILVYQGSKVSGAPFASTTLATSKSYNTVYQLGEYVLPTPAGALSGKFTVNADGKTIHFSKGNLWANTSGSIPIYNFEENQYDFPSAWDASHVGHFFWSQTESVAYASSYSDGSASSNDIFFTNNDQTTAKSDFTVYGVTGKYRTLSIAEWQYLFAYTESGANTATDSPRYNLHKYGVSVCEKANCIVLLPDNWVWDASTVGTDWQSGGYPETQTNGEVTWEVMEKAGAVCLPAAGNRYGSEVEYFGEEGYCWSSSVNGSDYAYYVSFYDDEVSPVYYGNRYYGDCVRLVTDASGGYSPAVKVTGVTLNKNKTEIEAGAKDTLVATVQPANATHKEVNWSSSDEAVATVDENGEVTGVAAGSAVIKATTADGNFTAVCLVTVTSKPLPAGALPGEFTVNAEGKKVHFSKGNLYYDGTNWGFENEQYYFRTYVGKGKCDAGGYNKDSGTASNHWGLFGWVGASSTKFTTSPEIYGVSTSTTSDDYGNVSGEALKADWGKAIDNKGTWRTLSGGSTGEWKYLFDHHVNVWGTCNNVPGRFIAPDGFDGDANALTATVSDWESAQAAGIVFLPAAGNRNGSYISFVGEYGFYWSSSANVSNNAYYVYFGSSIVYNDIYRINSYSVRLITDVK